MKIRPGFVSNSSSMSFIIVNKTDAPLALVDFVAEIGPDVLAWFLREYDWYQERSDEFNIETMLADAKQRQASFGDGHQFYPEGFEAVEFAPGETIAAFGDDDGDTLGNVFDYGLRDGGETERFRWRFHDSHR